MVMEVTRLERAIIALHDYGSREGATAKGVRKQMMGAGFTNKEINAASDCRPKDVPAAVAMEGGKR